MHREGTAVASASHQVIARPVFIVDPDSTSRLRVSRSLTMLGLTNPQVELPDHDRAITEVRGRMDLDPGLLPALVLMDWQAAGGMSLLEWMRETPLGIPVIVLSADDDAARVTRAYDLGARSYLVKPVGCDALAGVVRDLGLPWLLK